MKPPKPPEDDDDKMLLKFVDQIADRARRIPPENELLAGISPAGDLLLTEEVGEGHSFALGDAVEQIQVRGGTPKAVIERRLTMRAVFDQIKS